MEKTVDMDGRKAELYRIFAASLRPYFQKTDLDLSRLQEIRLRVNGPLMVIYDHREIFISRRGGLSPDEGDAARVTCDEIRETMAYISDYSLYAYEDEIRQGFITIQGGHRVGIAGKIVLEDGRIKSIKYISFINIRLAHQIPGCADRVMPYIRCGQRVYHTLIISPPRCGKTTILRDIVRQISAGPEGINVGVVDERSEIAACHMGIPQNDVGIRTDVLDCCPKAEGMMMLIRSMSPQVIAVDEVGSRQDIKAIEYVINCGCKLIATVHGSSVDDLRSRPVLRRLVQERLFERYVVLGDLRAPGSVGAVFDAFGSNLLRP